MADSYVLYHIVDLSASGFFWDTINYISAVITGLLFSRYCA